MNGEYRSVRLSKCSVGVEEKEAVCRVLDNQYLGMGKEVQFLEAELKAFLGTDLDVICVNTGTAALHLSVLCLDIKAGDEVLVPSITYVASFQAVAATGATPIACDVDPDTGFIDVADAEKRITKKTKAIMPVHYGSNAASMDDVYLLAGKHGLRVIEDAAQALGCYRRGNLVGTKGDILCFSLDGIKNITSGEGGVLVTSDSILAQRVRDARLLGVEKDTEKRYQGARSWVFDVKHQGFRYHMSDLMAAIGRAQLIKINDFAKKRKKLVQIYLDGLKDQELVQPLKMDYSQIVPHIFVVKVKSGCRDEVASKMQEMGVATGFHYYPNHLLSYFKTAYSLPVAESLGQNLMTLPLHVDLTEDDVHYVIRCLKSLNNLQST